VIRIGAHVSAVDPIGSARERDAELVQFFLSNPQSWKKPVPRDDVAELRASGLGLYAHAPYLINVAAANNRVRIPSRKILADTLAAAAELGMAGVVVHGGHYGDGEDAAIGWDRWRKALDAVELTVPILIENTAGGEHAVLREIEQCGPLWEVIGDYDVGVCLDTCHAWAAGEDLETIVARVKALTGHIDLVHLNDSRDPFDSRRDRHANLGQGEIPEELLLGVVREAGAPVLVETPGEAADQAADITWLRERLG
jgi:deoxyribonuclease-4